MSELQYLPGLIGFLLSLSIAMIVGFLVAPEKTSFLFVLFIKIFFLNQV
jgi:hypothetical protein